MTLDQIIQAERTAERAFKAMGTFATAEHFATMAEALLIIREARQFAATMADVARLSDSDSRQDRHDAGNIERAAAARLVAYMTPRD